MDPILVTALGNAIERALRGGEEHLARARSVKSANVAACIEYLRAVQSAITGLEASSAMYLEGVHLARPTMAFTQFLDLERIEVLRGPSSAASVARTCCDRCPPNTPTTRPSKAC